jgi:hypothetical protein
MAIKFHCLKCKVGSCIYIYIYTPMFLYLPYRSKVLNQSSVTMQNGKYFRKSVLYIWIYIYRPT